MRFVILPISVTFASFYFEFRYLNFVNTFKTIFICLESSYGVELKCIKRQMLYFYFDHLQPLFSLTAHLPKYFIVFG